MQLINPGKPEAFYAEVGPADSEEANELEAREGDSSASDSYYVRRAPTAYDGDTDALLKDETGKVIRYSYSDGKCYSEDGKELSDEIAERVISSGCVSIGNASSDKSIKQLIADTEPFIGSLENVELRNEGGNDED